MEKWVRMKTTVELPDALFRKAKAAAAERGITIKVLLARPSKRAWNAFPVRRLPGRALSAA